MSLVKKRKRINFDRIDLLVILVLIISLLAPAWLYIAKSSTYFDRVKIQQGSEVIAFIKKSTDDALLPLMQSEISSYAEVASVKLITASQAMQVFKDKYGSDKLSQLNYAELPACFLIKVKNIASQNAMSNLYEKLQGIDQLDLISLDSYWTEKLFGLLTVLNIFFILLVLCFVFLYVVIVFFVTKVLLNKKMQEMSLKLLLGATHYNIKYEYQQKFITISLIASIATLLITWLSAFWLNYPLAELGNQFNVNIDIKVLNIFESIILISSAVMLASVTAWFTSGKMLNEIERNLVK